MINIKKIKVTANYILVTKDEYDGKEKIDSIIVPAGTLKEYQKVVAVGPMVRSVAVGDLVRINPKRYEVRKFKEGSVKNDIQDMNSVVMYNFNSVELDHKTHLIITESDIDFVVEEYEEEHESPIITDVKPGLIV